MSEPLSDNDAFEYLGRPLLALLAVRLAEKSGISVDVMRTNVSETISDEEAAVAVAFRLAEVFLPATEKAAEHGPGATAALRSAIESSLRRRGLPVSVLGSAVDDLEALYLGRLG